MPINVPPNPRRPREKQLHRRTSHNYGRCACKSRSIKSWKVSEGTRWNWRKNLQNWSKEILTGRKCGQVERFAVGLGHGLLFISDLEIIPTKFLLLSRFRFSSHPRRVLSINESWKRYSYIINIVSKEKKIKDERSGFRQFWGEIGILLSSFKVYYLRNDKRRRKMYRHWR